MNCIPRAATKLDVTFITDTSAGAPGTHMVAEKTESGWSGIDDQGKRWHLFVGHLRNENLMIAGQQRQGSGLWEKETDISLTSITNPQKVAFITISIKSAICTSLNLVRLRKAENLVIMKSLIIF